EKYPVGNLNPSRPLERRAATPAAATGQRERGRGGSRTRVTRLCRPPTCLSTTRSGKSRRWGSNPLGPRYKGGARPGEHRRHEEQPVLVSSQLGRGSEPRPPPRARL